MHRIDGPAAAPGNLFTDGDPTAGTPATVVTDDWLNAVQEEVCNVILGASIPLSKPANNQLLLAIQALVAAAVPVGAVQGFLRSAAPSGWLKLNGQAVSRTTYAALFALLGTTYGAGDGSTTFNLPDFRGEFLRGLDDGRGVDAARVLGSSQAQQVQQHKHATSAGKNTVGPFGGTATGGRVGMTQDNDNFWDYTNDGSDYDGVVNAAGVVGTETRPRNVAVLWCIKAV